MGVSYGILKLAACQQFARHRVFECILIYEIEAGPILQADCCLPWYGALIAFLHMGRINAGHILASPVSPAVFPAKLKGLLFEVCHDAKL